jgi:hypothetical protein
MSTDLWPRANSLPSRLRPHKTIRYVTAALAHTTRRLVYECIDRALAMGPESALHDLPHGKQEHTMLPEDKAWVVRLACIKPKELGYAAELWTRRTLAEHCRRLPIRRRICRRCQASVRRSDGTMSTSGWARLPFWRDWTCRGHRLTHHHRQLPLHPLLRRRWQARGQRPPAFCRLDRGGTSAHPPGTRIYRRAT